MKMTEDDPLNGCSVDEIMALTYDEFGPEGLRELLAIGDDDHDREGLMEVAAKLEAAGLIEAAKLVAKAAARAETHSAGLIASILADPIKCNRRAYFAQAYRQGSVTMADLEAAGVDPDDLDFIGRSKTRSSVRFSAKSRPRKP